MKKFLLALMILFLSIPAFAFVGCKKQTNTENTNSNEVAEAAGYTATFDCDEHVSVLVYYTHDYSGAGEATTTAYSRNDETGEKTTDGTGQVNFKVVLDDGYIINSISATEGTYKNVKSSVETGEDNIYRITKITGDTTITITTAKSDEVTAYKATFVLDEGLSVLVGFDSNEYYSRSGDTGELLSDGNGQINFVVKGEIPEGKQLSVTATSGKYKNIKDLSLAEGIDNYYRITKITGDIEITISLVDVEEVI